MTIPTPEQRLRVIVPGMGSPHIEHKFDILRNNIRVLETGPWRLELLVFLYDNATIPRDMCDDARVTFIARPGILAEHLLSAEASSDAIEAAGCTHVMLLLDDVELNGPIDWNDVLALMDKTGVQIASPSLDREGRSPFPYMVREDAADVVMRVQTMCELFCYLMDTASYRRYAALLDARNPWMWGMEAIIHRKAGLLAGWLNNVTMNHHYWAKDRANHKELSDARDAYLARFGTTRQEGRKSIKVTRYVFREPSFRARLQGTAAGRWLHRKLYKGRGRGPLLAPLILD